jgi:two-component system, OmpR family, response regulator VanR
MNKILVVEDDIDIQELIKEFLVSQEYEVDVASDGLEGITMFYDNEYNLVMLDVMLPNIDGYSLCKMIKAKSNVPIIMLTALEDEKDEVKGFELGVDDYITKPFSFNILIKRVEAVLRRYNKVDNLNILKFEGIHMDIDAYKVYVDESEIELTTKEFEILKMLLENIGKVLSREVMLDKLWGYEYYGDARVIDTHIKNIRQKTGIQYIKTVKGIGYKIDK